MIKQIVDGYFMTSAYYDKPLKFCPYGSCGLIEYKGNKYLKSYSTLICKIDQNGWLQCSGLYSRTTIKHIGAFMKEFGEGQGYYTAKECYQTRTAFNLFTGEIKPLDDIKTLDPLTDNFKQI